MPDFITPASDLAELAGVAEAIAETASRLEKRALLAAYFAGLDPADLSAASRFLTGAPFARRSGLVPGVGYAQIRDAVLSVTGLPVEQWEEAYLRWSDLGDTARDLFQAGAVLVESSLSPSELAEELEKVARAPAGGEKQAALSALFRQLGPAGAWITAKILTGDLRIGLKEALVEDALALAFERTPSAVRRANQLVGDIGEVAIAAREGRLQNLGLLLFTPVKPMLATAAESPDEIRSRRGDELWLEDKYDGIRAQAHLSPGRCALYSRDLKEISDQFPEVAAVLSHLPGELILDGELLAHEGGRARPFVDLQRRLGRRRPPDHLLESAPVAYFAFDLLFQNGESMLELPLKARRARLDELPEIPGFYRTPVRVESFARLEEEFAGARSRANEGLMIKDPDSLYQVGRRGMSWLKYKRALDPLDVVVTGVEFGHGRRRDLLSDYTFAVRDDETGDLLNIGKAYSGLTDAEITELTAYFHANTLQSFGRFRLVRPELVIEVGFEAIQRSRRHRSGYALRFPRVLRLRPDKTAAGVNTLKDVAARYAQYRAMYDGDVCEAEAPEDAAGAAT